MTTPQSAAGAATVSFARRTNQLKKFTTRLTSTRETVTHTNEQHHHPQQKQQEDKDRQAEMAAFYSQANAIQQQHAKYQVWYIVILGAVAIWAVLDWYQKRTNQNHSDELEPCYLFQHATQLPLQPEQPQQQQQLKQPLIEKK